VRYPNVIRTTIAVAALTACSMHPMAAPDFTLTDDGGQAWTLASQRRPLLLTFGFSHCADTCPATLAKLAKLVRGLGTTGENVEIVMVTVDPSRDTPDALHRFVTRFNGPIVGLTGTAAQVGRVETAYHVWSQRIPGKHRDRQSYDVAHTAVIYAIDARGEIRAIANDDDSDAALRSATRGLVN
jgi:protein SCO1/2